MSSIKFFLIAIMMLAAITGQLAAADVPANPDSTHALGFHFGLVSGYGLSYRHFCHEGKFQNFGFQGVVGGYSSGKNEASLKVQDAEREGDYLIDTDAGRKYYINIGLNGIYELKRTSVFNFYLLGGMDWSYETKKLYHQKYDPADSSAYGNIYTDHKIKSLLSMGLGPGVEINLGRYFKLAVELPITYTGEHNLVMYIPQAGIYYYFR
ncbi:MAG TPA: hypothetical protein PKJ14_08010 [Candidatus Cloacimonadota bacterium]|nr:hypothetical protein [Candidatus Cloacimonadota bacterium]HQL15540.1 hypothetical protein [Candidatus Cloacimonadota bacterium]